MAVIASIQTAQVVAYFERDSDENVSDVPPAEHWFAVASQYIFQREVLVSYYSPVYKSKEKMLLSLNIHKHVCTCKYITTLSRFPYICVCVFIFACML